MGKNTDRSFLFFFRGICCLVFAYSHVKEASTGIIRTMHTQKKRQGGRRGRGGEGRETEMEQKRGEGERRWSNKDGGKKRSMPPIPTDLRDHSLPLPFRPFFAFFPPFLFPVFLPCNSLPTTCHPASPPCFWVCRVRWNARAIIPSFFIDLFRDTIVARTD